MKTHITVSMTTDEAIKVCDELYLLGCLAYDTHAYNDTTGPVSGWKFAELLHVLRLQATSVDHVDDFGEDGGS